MAGKMSGGGRGRTEGRFSLGQKATISVVPLVGVLLVLLIYMMITTHPTAASAPLTADPGESVPWYTKPTYVDVETNGRIFVGKKAVTLATLNAEVARIAKIKDRHNEQIAIKAGPYVSYSDFMTVMDTLEAGGYDHINLITENM
jgi:biopolymer transport protein ExbD